MAITGPSRVSGFKQARALMKELPEVTQRRVISRATNAGARVLLKAIKAASPVGDEPSAVSAKYGRLKMALRLQQLRRLPKGVRGHRVWTTFAFWGFFREFGTRHQPAKPWFGPAFETAAPSAADRVVEVGAAGILREAARLAARLGVR